MDIEKFKRNAIRSLVTKLMNEAEEILNGSELDVDLLDDYLKKLKEKDGQLKKINDKIESLIDTKSIETEVLDNEEFSDKIYKCEREINKKLKIIRKSSESKRNLF